MWEGISVAIIGGFIAAAGYFLRLSPPDFTLAKICASIAIALSLTQVMRWISTMPLSPIQLGSFTTVAVAVSGALMFGAFSYVDKRQARSKSTRIDEQKIKVFIAHAYLYGYCGATQDDPKNWDKIILPGRPIELKHRRDTEEYFVFGIANLNDRVPLEDARIHVFLDGRDGLEVRRNVEGQPLEKLWREHARNMQYWYPFPRITGEWLHSWNALYIKFPRPGTYLFMFEIVGNGIGKIKTTATIKVLSEKLD